MSNLVGAYVIYPLSEPRHVAKYQGLPMFLFCTSKGFIKYELSKPTGQLRVCLYQRRQLPVVWRACRAASLDHCGRANCGIT